MGVMISIILLLVATVLGAWRLETDFERENHPQPAFQGLDSLELHSKH
jgi:hypothetical protein